MSFDLDPDSFWRKTPREIGLILDGRSDAVLLKHNETAWAVWHVAALSRAHKLPPLEKLQHRTRVPRKRQTTEQMLEMAAIITALHGGDDKRKLN